jgi:diguanylate cyclase (GGDEF)-like protein
MEESVHRTRKLIYSRHFHCVCSAVADRILAAAITAVLLLPAGAVAAIVTRHPHLAVVIVLVNCGACGVGHAAATARHRRRHEAALADARRDPLTGLPNRAAADDLIDRATRGDIPMTVALIDVDGLRAVNTGLGHAAGDQYLAAVAARLSAAVPAGGLLVRQGGDEFTLLAPDVAPTVLATAIGAALAGPAVVAGHRMQPRASVGIATSGPQTDHDARDAVGRAAGFDAGYARGCADAAMYSAKAAGGNHILIYDPDRDGVPAPDGTRPLRRRRDSDPLAADAAGWLPTPGVGLVSLLLPAADLRTVHHLLTVAADRWAQTTNEAQAGGRRPTRPQPAADANSINIEPTPNGYRGLARIAADQQRNYTRLADQLAPIVEATTELDEPQPRHPGMAAAVLVGISAAFTPIEIEGLVRTAAEAVYGDPDDLSSRQRQLAARAYDLLQRDDVPDTATPCAGGNREPRP